MILNPCVVWTSKLNFLKQIFPFKNVKRKQENYIDDLHGEILYKAGAISYEL